MTKNKARELLEYWINTRSQDHLGEHRDMRLPIVDEMVIEFITTKGINQWSFMGLIKIAYDLKDGDDVFNTLLDFAEFYHNRLFTLPLKENEAINVVKFYLSERNKP